MKLDLHIHSRPATPEALSGVTEQLDAAVKAGLQGVALTDRGLFRGRASAAAVGLSMPDLRALGAARGLIVFAGAEIITTRGPILVYGIEPAVEMTFDQPVEVSALLSWARDNGGATVAPHLFRDGGEERYSELMNGHADWWLRHVNAFELAGLDNRVDHSAIEDLGRRLRKGLVNGSGAYYYRHVGLFSETAPDLADDAALVEWLRSFDKRRQRRL